MKELLIEVTLSFNKLGRRIMRLIFGMEKEMANHSSILAWEIPWTEKALWATVHGVAKESETT